MFTGLVQEVGRVVRTSGSSGNLRLYIEAERVSHGLELGGSVCVNGVCLTVVRPGHRFEVEVGSETLSGTNLSRLRAGSSVNLESPMKASSPFGGHFVTGHVDATAAVKSIRHTAGSQIWEIEIPRGLDKYIVQKGSVCVEGVSLTVSSLKPGTFTVALIPHTLASTTFSEKRPGDTVNIEVDILAKHIEKFVTAAKEKAHR